MKSSQTKSVIVSFLRSNGIALALFIIIVIALIHGLTATDNTRQIEQRRQIENNIRQAVISCYAIEGMYPDSLQYLQDNYGLHIDKEKYTVHYIALGSNIMPDITIIEG